MKVHNPIGFIATALAIAAAASLCGCHNDTKSEPGAPSTSSALAAPRGSGSAAAPAGSGLIPLTPERERDAQSAITLDCLPCHTDEMLAQQRLTAAQWGNVVKKMRGWGSKLEASSADLVVSYLSARYGLSAPPYEPKVIDAAAAADAIAPQPDGVFANGNAKAGAVLFKEDCATCHGDRARGTDKGMNIADRPILWRAADFAAKNKQGKGRMPAFPKYKDEDIANLLAHLRTIRPNEP